MRIPAITPTAATANVWTARRGGPKPARTSVVDDEDRRADAHLVVQPLRVRNLHADTAVRLGMADRPRLVRAVDADARRAQAHPARAERIPGPGRHRLQPSRPRILRRRVPPRVLLLDDDLELPERRRVDRLAGRDGERAYQVRPAEEDEPVLAAVDDDDRLGRRGRRRDDAERRLDRRVIALEDRVAEQDARPELLQLPPWMGVQEAWAGAT